MFSIKAIADAFGADKTSVAQAIFYTLAARPLGALAFGWLAEKIGRRPVLVIVVLAFAVLSALSGLTQTLAQLLIVRTLFGFAMGGEWGIGASLAMETIPPRLRGPVSGLVYQLGNLLSSYNVVVQSQIAESRSNDYGFALALFGGTVAVLLAI